MRNMWPDRTQDVIRLKEKISYAKLVREFVDAEKPFIVEGFLAEDVVRLADPAVLAREHGDIRLMVMTKMTSSVLQDYRPEHYREMSLASFVELLDSRDRKHPCYANQQPIQKFKSIERSVSFDSLIPQLRPKFVWFGSSEANIGLHFDASDGYLAQLHGRKRFFLISHKDSGSLYPFPDDVTRSSIDLRTFNPDEHPKMKDVVPYADEIGPGDLLYIPRYMWHYFWGTTTSLSVSTFHNEEKTLRRVLGLLRMYGIEYALGILAQMIKHGLLGKPYQIRGYGWPPYGLILWKKLTGKTSKWIGRPDY